MCVFIPILGLVRLSKFKESPAGLEIGPSTAVVMKRRKTCKNTQNNMRFDKIDQVR